MRTHVTFRTQLFDAETVKDYFINDCCFGDDCARWLIERLAKDGVDKVDAEPIQEDWGWVFYLSTRRFRFWVGISLYPDESEPPRWLAHIHRGGWSFLPWLRKPAKIEMIEVVCTALDRALRSSKDIREIRWYHEDAFMKGQEQDATEQPTSV